MTSIEAMLMKLQLAWAGHVLRMDDHRLPAQCLYGEVKDHKRSAGGQEKRFKDATRSHLDNVGIKRNEWETLAADRPAWRSVIHKGVQDYEKRRRNHAITKRQEQKARRDARTAGTAPPAPSGCGPPSVWLRRNGMHRPHRTLEISPWMRVKAVYDSSIRGHLYDDDDDVNGFVRARACVCVCCMRVVY